MNEQLCRAIYNLENTIGELNASNRWLNERLNELNNTVINLNNRLVEISESINKKQKKQ